MIFRKSNSSSTSEHMYESINIYQGWYAVKKKNKATIYSWKNSKSFHRVEIEQNFVSGSDISILYVFIYLRIF